MGQVDLRKSFYRTVFIVWVCSGILADVYVFRSILVNIKPKRLSSDSHFLKREKDYYRSDPLAGYVHQPHAVRNYDWPEFEPDHRIRLATNNLGFRKDSDTQLEKKPGVCRILVTGDSHVDGVVNNKDSFPNLLENALNQISKKCQYEVLNGGVGYYTVENYKGFLRKYLILNPDVCIVTLYLGNDFLEEAKLLPPKEQCQTRDRIHYSACLNDLAKISNPAASQFFNQYLYFRECPSAMDAVFEKMAASFLEIKALCDTHHIQFLVLILPTKIIEWKEVSEEGLRMLQAVQSSKKDIDYFNKRLLKRSIDLFSNLKITYVSLSPMMEEMSAKFFWDKDWHLSDKGHAFVAKILLIKLGQRLGA
jgi:lysophospholipase L1-like esterase